VALKGDEPLPGRFMLRISGARGEKIALSFAGQAE
jgi:hypothetical protein